MQDFYSNEIGHAERELEQDLDEQRDHSSATSRASESESDSTTAERNSPEAPPPDPMPFPAGTPVAYRPTAQETRARRRVSVGEKRDAASGALYRLLWLVCFVGVLGATRFLLPPIIEEVQYALTRGHQRAEYENATTMLADNPLEGLSKAYQLVSKRVAPSVVHINVSSAEETSEAGQDEFLYFFGPQRRQAQGQGSGVIMDPEGYIVTNYHVLSGASAIEVRLSDGRRMAGQIIGMDPPTDLAVLKVDADKLTAAEWGESNKLEVGALLWAAGSPFGLQRSITFGILSAKNRAGVAGTPYQDFLQTDAAVNPGNSGGPLVDSQGRVVGINSAIVGEAYQGISFAIPSSVAKGVYDRLRKEGRVIRGWLGVRMDEVSEDYARRENLPDTIGALVVAVVDHGSPSPARVAGIQPGDVIVKWNGEPIPTPTDLSRKVAETQIGTRATVEVRRGNEVVLVEVAVGERPSL